MLQQRINEMASAIINRVGDTVYTTSFENEQMLHLHALNGEDCWLTKGAFPFEEISFDHLQSGGVFIVQQNGLEMARYQYRSVKRGLLQVPGCEYSNVAVLYEVRKETYSSKWNVVIEGKSFNFQNIQDLIYYMNTKYYIDIGNLAD